MKDSIPKLIKFKPETVEGIKALAIKENRTFTAQVRHLCQKAVDAVPTE